ncbi:peptidase inhibitor family I36 protein [Streptomyces beigongshangae]|uniref:peptidase inhibitor family I36 protein n=1 Tax=Streptomyces beigongshangae TaxID=2841597 RepID=UPI001C845562|nr:peptidase inhibitor family I36 protein [Streptomyces sp. REN17]
MNDMERGLLKPPAPQRGSRQLLRTLFAVLAALLLLGGATTGAGAASGIGHSSGPGLCLQELDGSIRCYDSEAAALAASGAVGEGVTDAVAPMSLSDCAPGRFCIWAWPNYDSDGLWRWRIGAGTWQLQEGDIMNEGSSAYNHRSGTVWMIDSACPDYVLVAEPGSVESDFSDLPRSCGGTWNNRVDKVRLF